MLKHLWAILASGTLLLPAVAADEAITIKLKKAGKGDVVKETKTEDVTNDATVTVNGQEMKQNEKSSSKFVYTDEILERGEKDPKPTKLKRTYETADVTKAGKGVDLGLKGKTVAIEKGKDKYTFAVADGKLGEEATDLLDKEFNKKDDVDSEQLMLPKKPVKVGDTWEVDLKAVENLFGEEMSLDKDKMKATGKLVKVYDKDKAKFGVVEYTLDLPIASLNIMGQSVPATAGSKLKMTISLDGCIDGTMYGGTSTGKMEGELGLKVPMAAVAIKLNGTMGTKSEPAKK